MATQVKPDMHVAINGNHYVIDFDESAPDHWRGNCGRRYVIRMLNGQRIVTRNLWNLGEPAPLSAPVGVFVWDGPDFEIEESDPEPEQPEQDAADTPNLYEGWGE